MSQRSQPKQLLFLTPFSPPCSTPPVCTASSLTSPHYFTRRSHRRALANRDNKTVYESLDYDLWENQLWRQRHLGLKSAELEKLKKYSAKFNICRWAMCAAIGAVTALSAFLIDFSVSHQNIFTGAGGRWTVIFRRGQLCLAWM